MTEAAREVTSQKIFCARCVSESTDKTPGDISTLNGIGRKFYGSAEPCTECASVIRTLWWCFASIPIVPLSSYRYKTSQETGTRARFWCRKLPSFHWSQVLKTWVIGLALGAAAFYIIWLWKLRS
jgi:hypothetical protein